MKIKLYGTGGAFTKHVNTCALINEEILVDCGAGVIKALIADNFDVEKLNYIVVTHFHMDHDFDIPSLLVYFRIRGKSKPLTIYAPKGSIERYKTMCGLANVPTPEYKVIEYTENTFDINDYTITPYLLNHFPELINAYGFKISHQNKTASFSGDTAMCDNVHKLIKGSQIAFLDICGTGPVDAKKIHMDITEYEELKKLYPDVKLVPVHMLDATRAKLKELGYNPPNDGEVY